MRGMVVVDLRRSFIYEGTHYGPGSGVKVPESLALALGLAGQPADEKPVREPSEPQDGTDGAVDYAASWNKDDLQREVERRGIAVEGTGVNGRILKEDLVAALSADDATRATG